MKPTQEIIDELRKEAAHPPTPARVAGLFTEAADRIEHLYASGIHTCHADCQRPMCVLRRERDKALAELERVTAERDGYRSDIYRYTWNLAGCDTIASGWGKPGDYNKEMALPALDSVSRMAQDLATLRARIAELEAALRDMRDACKGEPAMNHQKYDALGIRVNNLLTRAESATPAKHPDTVRLDWLEEAPSERLADVRRIIWQQRDTCMVTRAAIDSAMKEHP